MVTSPPSSVARQILLLEPVAERHVLRVSELWRRERLAAQVVRGLDVLADHEGRATGGRTCDHPDGVAATTRRRR